MKNCSGGGSTSKTEWGSNYLSWQKSARGLWLGAAIMGQVPEVAGDVPRRKRAQDFVRPL